MQLQSGRIPLQYIAAGVLAVGPSVIFPPLLLAGCIELEDDESIQNLFVDGDRLVIFSTIYDHRIYLEDDIKGETSSLIEPWYASPETQVTVFDIGDSDAPTQVREIVLAGTLVGARLIDGFVYVIQVGSFPEYQEARSYSMKFSSRGYPVEIYEALPPDTADNKKIYLVRVGNYTTLKEAEGGKKKLETEEKARFTIARSPRKGE